MEYVSLVKLVDSTCNVVKNSQCPCFIEHRQVVEVLSDIALGNLKM
jgi:hypothetical protein